MGDTTQPQTAAQWVKQHSQHRRNIRLVLMELAGFIDAGNNCPSHNELAEATGLSKPTVQHALEALEKDGTVAITRHGGDKKNGGKKNCYHLPGMSGTPVKLTIPGKNNPVKPEYPGKELPGKTDDTRSNFDDLSPFTEHETGTTEYVRAAGEQMLLSVTSSVLSVLDNQTDYHMPVDTRAILPAQTEDDLQRDYNAASRAEQELASKALERANPPATGHQDEPPGSGEPPLPPFVLEAYQGKWQTVALGGEEQSKLRTIISKHGLEALQGQVEITGRADGDGNPLASPAGYMLRTLNKQKAMGSSPSFAAQKPTPQPAPVKRAEPERTFMTNFKGFQTFETEQEATPC